MTEEQALGRLTQSPQHPLRHLPRASRIPDIDIQTWESKPIELSTHRARRRSFLPIRCPVEQVDVVERASELHCLPAQAVRILNLLDMVLCVLVVDDESQSLLLMLDEAAEGHGCTVAVFRGEGGVQVGGWDGAGGGTFPMGAEEAVGEEAEELGDAGTGVEVGGGGEGGRAVDVDDGGVGEGWERGGCSRLG